MPLSPHLARWDFDFGEPDEHGIIGESDAAWQLRADIAAAAQSIPHVLVLGESGTGKELAARAIHALSPRAKGPFIARSAATFTSGLLEAELFGNAKNFPNPGMPENAGFIAAAHGGTLFLDEIGELPHAMQAPLLRVLDGDGEYHRLGETKLRRADVRLIGAMNRDVASLKHDFAARLGVRVQLPPLGARREDIPLLVRRLVMAAAKGSPGIAGKFVYQGEHRKEIHIDAALMTHLVQLPYSTHIRELSLFLWEAIRSAKEPPLSLNSARKSKRDAPQSSSNARPFANGAPHSAREARDAPDKASKEGSITRAQLIEALDKNHWHLQKTARALGLSSRFALARLMRKYAIK